MIVESKTFSSVRIDCSLTGLCEYKTRYYMKLYISSMSFLVVIAVVLVENIESKAPSEM